MSEPIARTSRIRWSLYGALFGLCFPIMAGAIRVGQVGAAEAAGLFTSDPLLWIIATAPLFLGAFACLGGVQHDKVSALTRNLENRVQLRTRELAEALGGIRMILDNAGDGFVSASYEGQIEGEVSAAARDNFGEPRGQSLEDWLFGSSETQRLAMALGLMQLRDDYLPFEVLADQLPAELARDGRQFELNYRKVESNDRPTSLLVVLRDVTARNASLEAARLRAEKQAVVAQLIRCPEDFKRYRDEMRRLVDAICDSRDSQSRARSLHTLKGSAGVMGFVSLAAELHTLETQLAEGVPWTATLETTLRRGWSKSENLTAEFATLLESKRLHVSELELNTLLQQADKGMALPELVDTLNNWRLPPVRGVLERLAGEAKRIGERVDHPVECAIEDNGVRLAMGQMAEFWQALTHVVRNAVDHGIEPTVVRIAANKPCVGALRLSTHYRDHELIVSLSDDGRGIDWEGLRQKAQGLQLPNTTQDELLDVLFHDGVSTRSEISEVSGRGVGLAAVREVCSELGIQIRVESQLGKGTRFEFIVPATVASPQSTVRAA